MINFIKKNSNLIIVFIFALAIYIFLGFYVNNGDPTASYGFSRAIKNGEIIYRDFNTISTPLYAFYCSIFLLIWDDFLMFIIAQSLLVTVMFYFLFKLLGNKAWVVLLSMILFKFFGFNATYNFCCLAMSIIVLYLEEKHPKKDLLIGVFLALTVLSKQTVGLLLVLPSLIICFKDYKRLLKRIIGFIIPISIFTIYLLITKSLYSFIDLCFLGLFDFGGNNNYLFTFWFYCTIVLVIINIMFIIKNKRITDYYGLMYIGFVLPIFDLNHFAYYFTGFTIIALLHIKELNKYKKILVTALIIEFTVFNYFMGIRADYPIFYKNINHFKYRYNYEKDHKMDERLSKYIDKYVDMDPILIMYYSMSYNISHDRYISYFDIFLYGNHGYNGTKKMINRIKKMKNQYFIINMEEYTCAKDDKNQFNVDIIDYIVDNSEKVECKDELCVYYKK